MRKSGNEGGKPSKIATSLQKFSPGRSDDSSSTLNGASATGKRKVSETKSLKSQRSIYAKMFSYRLSKSGSKKDVPSSVALENGESNNTPNETIAGGSIKDPDQSKAKQEEYLEKRRRKKSSISSISSR